MGVSPWAVPAAGIVVVALAGVFGGGWAWFALGVLLVGGAGGLAWGVLKEARADSVGAMGSSIRPIVLGLVRRGGALLVFEGRDDLKGETFYRPLGGGIEYGERSEDALKREFREELDAEIEVKDRVGVLENVYTWQGRRGHEIAFLYDAEFADEAFYARDRMKIIDDPATALWVDVQEFKSGEKLLYPTGLTELLSSE
jgi:ADP-ribose pyrophosphatase YjhB (NUDIX family)